MPRREAPHRATTGALAPADIGALLKKGLALQMQGQLWPAQECYRAILERDPGQPDALHLTGLIAIEAGRIEAAIRMFKQAVSRKPADPALRGSYAEALIQNNDPVAAERQLRRAQKLSSRQPGNPVQGGALSTPCLAGRTTPGGRLRI